MSALGIFADPIYRYFIFERWIIGYTIHVAFTRIGMIRLYQRKAGRTKKGQYYAWRTASPQVSNKKTYTFTKMCHRAAKTKSEIAWSLYGLNDIRGESYNSKATPKYLYTGIITLDFGKK